MQRECPQFRSFHWLPAKEKNQQINVERSLFQIRSLRRLVSALAISGAHVSIYFLGMHLWTICSGVQKIRITDHITNVQAIVEKPTQPIIIFEFIIKTADGAAFIIKTADGAA